MKVNNYPLKTPSAGDKLFGSDSNGDQKQFDMSNFGTSTYKVYVALLTQTGTNPPVATVLENTIGNIVWSYDGIGRYTATLQDGFTVGKSVMFLPINRTPFDGTAYQLFSGDFNDQNSFWLNTMFIDEFGIKNINDGILYAPGSIIEIRVYN